MITPEMARMGREDGAQTAEGVDQGDVVAE
jgi:hypothetical protein